MSVAVNGKQITEFSIDAEYPNKKEYVFTFGAKPNFSNQITLTFPNDFGDPKNKDLQKEETEIFFVESVEISSPEGVSQNVTMTRTHLLGKWKTEEIGDEEAKTSFDRWLPRIYRSPPRPIPI